MSPSRISLVNSLAILCTVCFLVTSCTGRNTHGDTDSELSEGVQIRRETKIPLHAVKVLEADDEFKPILHMKEWEEPTQLGPPINTAGGEDSPFITPDGSALYFTFMPDVNVPPEKQLLDGVTGIWMSERIGDEWTEPKRVVLQDSCEVSLDGCEFILGDLMYFCSARKGNYRDVDIWIAHWEDGKWKNWNNAGKKLNVEYRVGELHISADGEEMYFASDRPGGKGKRDIWVSKRRQGEWQAPVNLTTVNSRYNDNQPFVSEDGKELWFTSDSTIFPGTPAVYRSLRTEAGWSRPQEIVSNFCGDPCFDRAGNMYFTHAFFKRGKAVEADIYVAKKKRLHP